MRMTHNNEWIDDIRRRIQTALNGSKIDILREQFGMIDEHRSPDLPSEIESEWLDYILEFERQFENAPRITVRARIGDPSLLPIAALSPDKMVEAVDALMEMLEAHHIAVEFLGDVDYETVYRYLTEELLNEEIDDTRLPDTWIHFIYTTDTYNAEMWVEDFVVAIFRHDIEQVRVCIDDKLWADNSGKPTTVGALEALWANMPVVQEFNFEVLESLIDGDRGHVLGRITWSAGGSRHEIEVTFQVYRSRYLDEAWGIDQTSLIDDLIKIYG